MLKSNLPHHNSTCSQEKQSSEKDNFERSPKIALLCKTAVGIIGELYSPLDAINRFINLALQSLEENSQSREFLIESKKGIRKTSLLLKRLNNFVRRIEKEASEISLHNE